MSGRGLLILALLAALAVGGAWLTRRQADPSPSVQEAARFIPSLLQSVDQVTAVDVRAADGTALARLVRRGGSWVVVNRWNYPADLQTLRSTLIGLAEARRLEPRTERVAGHARLGVGTPGTGEGSGLEVRLEGIEPEVAVVIGQRAAGEVDGTYVRRAGEPRAWLVSGRIERHEQIGDWLDDRLVDIPPAHIQRVRIEPVDGKPVRVVSSGSDASGFELRDIPQGMRPLSNSIPLSIARGVTQLHLTDVQRDTETRLPPRLAVARFETIDGLVIEIEAFTPDRGQPSAGLARLHAVALAGAGAAVQETVEQLKQRYAGWRYRIPDYKFVNLTHRLASVLQPEPDRPGSD